MTYSKCTGLFKVLLLLASAFAACIQVQAVDFYVSTIGNDAHDGSSGAPFLTLAQAQSAVRDVLLSASEPIHVWVEGGTYYLSEPLAFGPLDSGSETVPVTYAGMSNETVVISGAVTLTPSWSSYSGSILVADIGTGYSFDVLFADGDQQVLARYPDYDEDTVILNGYANESAIVSRTASWSDPTTGFLRALHSGRWGGQSYKITGVNTDGSLGLEWVGDNNRGSDRNKSYQVVENIFEELDAPGEWFYNETIGMLYFYPPSGMDASTASFEAATAEELIRVVGDETTKVKYLTFDNFTFTQTHRTLFTRDYEPLLRSDWCVARAGAIYMEQAENITVSNSAFNHLGGNAIFMSGYNRDHLVTWNEFEEIGATCVNMVGWTNAVRYPSFWDDHKTDIADTTPGPQTEDYPKDITVSYNHMYNIGRFEKQSCGVNISMSESITVNYNTVHRSARAGLNVCDGTWGGHLFEYNDVFDCVRETSDHGPFNSWGRDRFWSYLGYNSRGSNGAAKKPYAFLDAWKTTVIRNNRFQYDEPTSFGIDLDDGSSNYEVYNNLLLNTGIKLRDGFERKVYNNITINHVADLHVWFDECEDICTNNIIVNSSAYGLAGLNSSSMPDKLATIDYNLFYYAGESVSIGYNGWTDDGFDVHSITANPLFIEPSSNNYTVATNSPALALGFTNFSMGQFGKPGAPEPEAIEFETEDSIGADPEPLMGAEACSIWNESIQSALGAPDLNGVYLYSVPAGSYAESQSFEAGDVIRSINGTNITDKQSFWLLYHVIAPGTEVSITYLRDQIEVSGSFVKMSSSEELNDTAGLVYSGNWLHQDNIAAFNEDLEYNSQAGDYFELTFYGKGIEFTSQKNSDMGNLDIYIDGVLDETVSCYNGSRLHQQTVYKKAGLTAGIHTLRVENAEDMFQIIDSFTIKPSATTSDISTDATISFAASDDALSNTNGIVDWGVGHLVISDGSNLSNIDFPSLGISSWTIDSFGSLDTATWDGANFSGLSLICTGHNFGYNDSMVGLDFSGATFTSAMNQPWLLADATDADFSGATFNITMFKGERANAFRGTTLTRADFSGTVWNYNTAGTLTNFELFDGGPGTTSAADKEDAVTFVGADLSTITGQGETAMIANLGAFDGDTAIGAKYDQAMLDASGWTAAELDAAGWQFVPPAPEFLSGITLSNGIFSVQFTGTTGEYYRLERKAELTSSNDWQTVTNIISLGESPMELAAPMTNSAGFYRLIWLP